MLKLIPDIASFPAGSKVKLSYSDPINNCNGTRLQLHDHIITTRNSTSKIDYVLIWIRFSNCFPTIFLGINRHVLSHERVTGKHVLDPWTYCRRWKYAAQIIVGGNLCELNCLRKKSVCNKRWCINICGTNIREVDSQHQTSHCHPEGRDDEGYDMCSNVCEGRRRNCNT